MIIFWNSFQDLKKEEIYPDEDYKMSGNKISVKTLDLNTEFSEIFSQLNMIVYNEFMK